MPTLTLHDATLTYSIDGSGPALLLVHGMGPGSEIAWSQFAPHFTSRQTVLQVDLSDSDTAVDSGGAITIEVLVDQLVAAIEAAGVGTRVHRPFRLGGQARARIVLSLVNGDAPLSRVRDLYDWVACVSWSDTPGRGSSCATLGSDSLTEARCLRPSRTSRRRRGTPLAPIIGRSAPHHFVRPV